MAVKLFRVMKPASISAVFAFVALVWVAAPGKSHGQDESPLDPGNFTSSIAKKLAAQITNPAELQKTMVTFVNTSPSPLMCKLKVAGIWEQVLRSQASLDNYKQVMVESRAKMEESMKSVPASVKQKIQDGVAESNIQQEKNMLNSMTKELTLNLDLIDTYCGASKSTKK